jgi:hypothetical protein
MLDNKDINAILEKLENMEDEELAVELLREFNSCSGKLGKLLLNLDKNLAHDVWKNECDKARLALDTVVKRINDL